jgi:2-polyprenyl-3-methyl-5-hydroxy-6-metoxy-1,4-benzoquinol methylase
MAQAEYLGSRRRQVKQVNMSPPAAMRENEIRPEALREGQMQAYERDLVKLRKRLPEFVTVNCPACDANRSAAAFEKYGFKFRQCRHCRTVYMSPRPTPEIMGSYYGSSENYKYWAEHIFPASEPARREKIHRPVLEYIAAACARYAVPRGLLLEVGPGFGTFAALAKESGLFDKILAIERTPEMADACRKRGVEVIELAVEDVSLEGIGLANVVVSFEVIEHLYEPRGYIERCAQLIAPGGILVLSCPNGLGFDVGMLGAAASAVDSEHVNLFNPASLSSLLERSGFEVLEATTPGRLDAEFVRAAALAGQIDLSADAFLRRVLLEEWDSLGAAFQQFLASQRLSSHMRIIARRD